MLAKPAALKFYKRKEIQEEMVRHAQNKEVGIRFAEGFGKRPDILTYPREIIELARQGATSFHCSEERWESPTSLSSDSPKKELDELRTGWDLVLDIDCLDWEISKLTAHLFIKALKDNYVKDVSCKFSGNKGMHIGVPFEAFPKEVAGKKTKELFPEGPKKISQYLLNYITENYVTIKENKVVFDNQSAFSLEEFREKFGEKKFIINVCSDCRREVNLCQEETYEFICPKCDKKTRSEKEFAICEKCHVHMRKIEERRVTGNIVGDYRALCRCGAAGYRSIFNPLSIINVDTLLISSRHLYRMPYSLHEKSGLVSLPIDPGKVLEFEKEMARPEKILTPMFTFLSREAPSESARSLLVQALDFKAEAGKEAEQRQERQFEEYVIESPIGEEYFPPCIRQIQKGMEDGRKRSVFILVNFLGKLGWSKQDVEKFLHDWNKKNPVPLREVYIKGQLGSFQPGAKLPPNCNNEAYYLNIGIKCDSCDARRKFKNPVNYALWRWRRRAGEGKENKQGNQRTAPVSCPEPKAKALRGLRSVSDEEV